LALPSSRQRRRSVGLNRSHSRCSRRTRFSPGDFRTPPVDADSPN
jgi:hypothetical protein